MSMKVLGGGGRGRGSKVEELPIAWGEWHRCIMIRRRESITGKQICGFGWMRREGFYEDPNLPGYEVGQLTQFAKNKKEIFKFKLTEPEYTNPGWLKQGFRGKITRGRGGRKYA